jgi:hypothetical protein
MKRGLFMLITAILALLFGGLMFLAPAVAGGTFGISGSVATDALFRILGATLLSLALLNFLVRNQPTSQTLAAVLWTDFTTHGLGLIADLWSVGARAFTLTNAMPGLVVHLFVGIGALVYIFQPRER